MDELDKFLLDIANEGVKDPKDSVMTIDQLLGSIGASPAEENKPQPEVNLNPDQEGEPITLDNLTLSPQDQKRAQEIQTQTEQQDKDMEEFAARPFFDRVGRTLSGSWKSGTLSSGAETGAELARDGNWVDAIRSFDPIIATANFVGGIAQLAGASEKTQEALKTSLVPFYGDGILGPGHGKNTAALRDLVKEETKDFNEEAYADLKKYSAEKKEEGEELSRGAHGFAADVGGIIPNVAELATVIVGSTLLPPAAPYLSGAYLGKMGWTSFGQGLQEFDEYEKEKGRDPLDPANEDRRLAVGLSYAASEVLAERFLQGITRYLPGASKGGGVGGRAGKWIHKKLLGSEAGREAIESATRRFASEQPALWKKIVSYGIDNAGTALHEIGEESVTEAAQFFIDNLLIRDIGDKKELSELLSNMAEAAKGAILMSIMLGPVTKGGSYYQTRMRRRGAGGLSIGLTKDGQAFEIVGEEDGMIVGNDKYGQRVDIDPESIVEQAFISEAEYEAYASSITSESQRAATDFLAPIRSNDGDITIVSLLDNTDAYLVSVDGNEAVIAVDDGTYDNGAPKTKRKVIKTSQISTYTPAKYADLHAAIAQEIENTANQAIEQTEQEAQAAHQEQQQASNAEAGIAQSKPIEAGDMVEYNGEVGVLSIEADGSYIVDGVEGGSQLISPEAINNLRKVTTIPVNGQEFLGVETDNGLEIQHEFSTAEEAAGFAAVLDQQFEGKRTFRVEETNTDDINKPNTFQVIGGEFQAPSQETAPVETGVESAPQSNDGGVESAPQYAIGDKPVSRGYLRAKIRNAKSRADLEGIQVNNDAELEQMILDKFPEGTYTFDGDAMSREETMELIESANTLEDLEGLAIDNDAELEQSVVDKFPPKEEAKPKPITNLEGDTKKKAAEEAEQARIDALPVIKMRKPRRPGFSAKSRTGKALRARPVSLHHEITQALLSKGMHPDLFRKEFSQTRGEFNSYLGVLKNDGYTQFDKMQESMGDPGGFADKVPLDVFTEAVFDVMAANGTRAQLLASAERYQNQGTQEGDAWGTEGQNTKEYQEFAANAKYEYEQQLEADRQYYEGPIEGVELDSYYQQEEHYYKLIAEEDGRESKKEGDNRPLLKGDVGEARVRPSRDNRAHDLLQGGDLADRGGSVDGTSESDGAVPGGDIQPGRRYGESNRGVKADRYQALREKLRKKGGQLNSGFDPEMFAIGAEMAAYHIEAGSRSFASFAKAMIDDVGDWVKPYLKSFYSGARNFPGMEQYAKEMDGQDAMDATDLSTIHGKEAQPQEVIENKAESKRINEEAKKVDTSPTDGQKEAGNYKKGHTNLQGLDITIENGKGTVRSGTDGDGQKWEVTLNNHYGYFKRTQGKDGDQVDVFIGDKPTSNKVFIVDQVDPATGIFDEHKVMMGFSTKEEALSNYNANYSEGWEGAGAVLEMNIDEFKDWLGNAKRTIKPASLTTEGETKLTPNQQADLDKNLREIDADLEKAKVRLESAQKERDKKANDPNMRNGLFGDTKEGPDDLFAGTFVMNKETLEKAMQPYVDKVANAKKEVDRLEKLRKDTQNNAGQQGDVFGGVLTNQFKGDNLNKKDDNVPDRPRDSQPDSRGLSDQEQADRGDVQSDGGRSGQDGTRTPSVDTKGDGQQSSSEGIPDSRRPLFGERSDRTVQKETPIIDSSIAGDIDGRGSDLDSREGDDVNRRRLGGEAKRGAKDSGESFKERTARAIKEQKAAESIPVKLNDEANIRETLPMLLAEQQDDVVKAEARFFGEKTEDSKKWANGKGMMFTNGTGTGKTFSGLGVVKRFLKNGAKRVLIVSPASKTTDWLDDAKKMNIEGRVLESTKDTGDGVIITSVENFRANQAILEGAFDLVMYDESHKLMEDKDGKPSATTQAHFLISNRSEREALNRIKAVHPLWIEGRDLTNQVREISKEMFSDDLMDILYQEKAEKLAAMEARLKEIRQEQKGLEEGMREQAKKDYERTKVVFLSATPFKSVFNLRYAQGILFDWGNETTYESASRGWSRVDPESRFFMDNFGAQFEWKYHRLQTKGKDRNDDAVTMQEVQFAERMMDAGVMSGRTIESNMDYSREFPIVANSETFDSEGFNKAYSEIYNYDSNSFEQLRDAAREVFFSHHDATLLFEVLNTSMSLDRMQAHLDMGRKVAVYHRRQNGVSQAPFANMLNKTRLKAQEILNSEESGQDQKAVAQEMLEQASKFEAEHKDVLKFESTLDYRPAPIQIKERFGDRAVVFTEGSKKEKADMVKRFNTDGSGIDVIIIQEQSGKEGISLHDTTGKHPRVVMQMSKPNSSIAALQIEGRIYRIGQESNAIFEYPILGLDMELAYYGSNLNKRLSTTENLAMGNQSRDLIRSFSEGIMYHASNDAPSLEQGSGGKEFDRREKSSQTPFQRARLVYATNQKTRGRRDQREGVDFYATPEPVGQKMVEWANVRAGDNMLEPSAGDGAIAMWMPKHGTLTAIEPSFNLYAKMAARTGDLSKKVINENFESLHSVNKFESVVMNPPFGRGGKLAMDHLEKAFMHLKQNGRVVALIPRGQMDGRVDKWLSGVDDKGRALNPNAHLVASINMPTVTFDQAGTAVSTRIVIIDKVNPDQEGLRPAKQLDFSQIKDINELFDNLEDVRMPERLESDTQGEFQQEETVAPKEYAGEVLADIESPMATYLEQKHSKTGAVRHTVPLGKRVSRDTFQALKKEAGKDGGFWSAYRGQGVTPAFEFKTKEAADNFINAINNADEVNEKKSTYKTKGGEAIQYELAFGADDQASTIDVQQKDNRATNPSLRRLEPGEVSAVEAKYSTDKNFVFNGSNKIESTDDVAFMFRQLETKSVENMFAVFVDENNKPTVMHISMGSRNATLMENSVLADGISRLKPKKVYLLHNHPSGNLQYSDADVNLHARIKEAFGDVIGEHIIINTTSGKYASFNTRDDHQIHTRPTSTDNAQDYKVLKFDKQVFRSNTALGKVKSSEDAAQFISAQRFSTGNKMSAIIMASSNNINAYLHLPSYDLQKQSERDALISEVQALTARFAGVSVILANNGVLDVETTGLREIKNRLKASSINLLDVITVKGSETISAADHGVLEPKTGYVKNLGAEEDGARYSRKQNFYSPTERALSKVQQAKGTPDQFKAMLLKNGSKQAELNWMDWDSFAEGKKSITKEDVQAWIEENKVTIEEVVKQDIEDDRYIDRVDAEDMFSMDHEIYGVDENGVEALIENKEDLDNFDRFALDKDFPTAEPTKYSDYTIPGGLNYKELLLTMANNKTPFRPVVSFERWNKNRLTWGKKEGTEAEWKTAMQDINKKNFKSSHYDEQNIVAHVRFNDRITKDGKKMLLIEEIQSDWAQKGREEGFAGEDYVFSKEKQARLDELEAIRREEYGTRVHMQAKNPTLGNELAALENEMTSLKKKRFSILPNMPFAKTDQWAGLVLKRMLQHAAENGYDAIGWTTGEQQADRYDLSNQIDGLSVSLSETGYQVKTLDKNGSDDRILGVFDKEGLPGVIGKEMAQKAVADLDKEKADPFGSKNKIYTGLDLKVGGEGMKSFYDNMLPSIAKKVYGKKTKVGQSEIMSPEFVKGGVLQDKTHTVHSIDISEQLRDAGLEEQAMFKRDLAPTPNMTASEFVAHREAVKERWNRYKEVHSEVKELSKKYNTPIHAIKSFKDLPESIKVRVHKMDQGEIQGVFDPKTKEVYIISDNLEEGMTERVVLHEVLAHKGLRNVLGDKYNDVLNKVYDSMPEADKKSIAKLYGTSNPLIIADEYIAQLAEGYKRPGQIKRIVAQIRQIIREVFGIDYSDADIMYLLSRSEDAYIRQPKPDVKDYSSAGEYLSARLAWENGRDGEVATMPMPQTESKNFSEWFGESKIVDKKGKPQVYYHATGNDFDSFQPNRKGLIFASPDAKWAQEGFMPLDKDKGTSGSVMPVFVKAENPFDYRNKAQLNEFLENLDARESIKDHMRNGSPWGLEKPVVIKALREAGYDSFYVTEEGVTNIGVFEPNQVKSAIGNDGGFDPSNDDVRFKKNNDEVVMSETQKEHPADLAKTGDKLREAMQDRMITVKRVQQEVAKRAGLDKMEWWMDAYEQENRSHGRVLNAQERLNKDYTDPLIRAVYDVAKDDSAEALSELQRYLKAKHAPERNRVISKRKELDTIENQSGFTDEQAAQIVYDYELDKDKDSLDRLWEQIRKTTNFTLNRWLEDGFISKQQHDELTKGEDAYKYYVPLRGYQDAGESIFEYQSRNAGKSVNPYRAAKGRKSESEDPIQYIVNMANTAIVMGENNRVKQYAYRMATNHLNDDLYHIKKVYYVATGVFDENGKEKFITEYESPDQKLWDEGKVQVKYNNKKMAIDKRQSQEHEVEVMVGGERIMMRFENPEVASALNKENITTFERNNWLDALARGGGKVTRVLTANFTAKNPGFIVPNSVRDIAYAWISHGIKGGGKDAARFTKHLATANVAMSDYSRWESAKKRYERATNLADKADAKRAMEKADTKNRKAMELFLENGGATGYVHLKDVDAIGKDIAKELKRAKRAKDGSVIMFNEDGYIRVWKRTGEILEALAERSENMSRLATFMVAMDRGASAAEAATEAKNITVNFNRKGSQSNVFGSFYAFLNAAIQGGENISRIAKENPGKFAMGASMLYSWGFLTALLSHLNDGDDDDPEKENRYKNINDYTKQNHFTVRYGKQRYISIPLPHGWRMFYGVGVSTFENLFLDEEKKEKFNWAREDRAWDKLSFDFADRMMDAVSSVNPVDAFQDGELTVGGAAKVLAPTAFTPFVDILNNRDFAGREIARLPYTKQNAEFDANAGMFKPNVNPLIKKFTDKAYLASGGDLETYTKKVLKDGELKDVNKMWDLNPSRIEHLITYYTGGRGSFFNDLYKTTSSVVEGMANVAQEHPEPFENFDANDIPVLNRFNRKAYDYDDMNWYYGLKDDVAQYKLNRSRMGIERDVLNLNPRMEMLDDMVKDVDKQLKQLRELKRNPGIIADPEEFLRIRKAEQEVIREFRKAVKGYAK